MKFPPRFKHWRWALAFGVIIGSNVTLASLTLGQVIGYSGAAVMQADSSFRMGYAVGAHDMLQAVVIAHRTTGNPAAAAGFLQRALDCLNTLANAMTIPQFTRWAESQWMGSDTLAATLIITRVCP